MAKENKDLNLLEDVVVRWGKVQKENVQDSSLVSDDEWNQWENFNKTQSEKLLAIVDRFNGALNEQDKRFVENLNSQIDNAKRMTTDELWDRKIEEGFDDARREALRGSFDHS